MRVAPQIPRHLSAAVYYTAVETSVSATLSRNESDERRPDIPRQANASTRKPAKFTTIEGATSKALNI
jgi:hypothetical protein